MEFSVPMTWGEIMLEEKIKKLEEKNVPLWFHGSPLVLCSMHLNLNIGTGKLFAAAKFLNVQPEHIKEFTVDIICYDVIRNIIDTVYDYTYMGFDVERNRDLGFSNEIPIPNTDTRNIEFVLKSVTTINDETWYNESNFKFNISLEQKDIFSVQGDLNKHFIELCTENNIDSSQLIFQPVFDKYHWMCSCGCLNWNDEDNCSQCGVSAQWLKQNVSEEALERQKRIIKLEEEKVKAEVEKQLQQEKERQQAEFQQRQQQYQKQVKKQRTQKITKNLVIVILIIAIVAGVVFGVINYLIPYISYSNAKKSLDQGMYDSAIKQFTDIGDFLDSQQLLLQAKYKKADDLYYSGNKAEAAEVYKSISEYSDSQQKYYEIIYETANNYYSEKDYINAAENYLLISEYLDCDKRLESSYENLYTSAVELLNNNVPDKAYEYFSYLVDYSDSEQMLNECIYKTADKYYSRMEYKNALDTYNQIKDYKDVPQILKKLKNLSDIISAASDMEAPAVWSCENMSCGVCNSKDTATYSLAFGINGNYTFEISCANHESKTQKTGHYKIENDKIYTDKHQLGVLVWEETMTIISVEKLDSGTDGKNAVFTVTSPFNKKQNLTLYGNIISSNNIVF